MTAHSGYRARSACPHMHAQDRLHTSTSSAHAYPPTHTRYALCFFGRKFASVCYITQLLPSPPDTQVGTCSDWLYDNIFLLPHWNSVDVSSIFPFPLTRRISKDCPQLREGKEIAFKERFGAEHKHSDDFDLGPWFYFFAWVWHIALRKLHSPVSRFISAVSV